jgi:hypothetical protein
LVGSCLMASCTPFKRVTEEMLPNVRTLHL